MNTPQLPHQIFNSFDPFWFINPDVRGKPRGPGRPSKERKRARKRVQAARRANRR